MDVFGGSLPRYLYAVSNWLWLAFLVLWLVWGLITTRQRRVVTRGSSVVPLWVMLFLLLFFRHDLLGFIPELVLWPGHTPAAVAGLLVQAAGLGLSVWARYYLGSFWSSAPVLREGHKVVASGPYRLVRHPIYSGLLLAVLGTFLMNGSTFSLLALILATGAMWWKAWSEERLLTAELGDEYVNYRRRTCMLIPWLL
ncbi:MAG: isoprenylcysteine carboxylmethyltransferase family protein [Peptococcaceae bacterium]|jgi:protein-S-isoprenylcysteine O-methyltransferase Ste14|nr:isoprenylcysteine carboxylmethyltransferase family protein [Peptococcaceae bacterium]